MEQFTEQQQAAHQTIAEIVADLGPAFVLDALADALAQTARSETGSRGDNLSYAVSIVRQLAEVLDDRE